MPKEPFNIPMVSFNAQHALDKPSGTVTIEGLELPDIEPIDQIWGEIRKANRKLYKTDIVANFCKERKSNTITINLILNAAVAENNAAKYASIAASNAARTIEEQEQNGHKLTKMEKNIIHIKEMDKIENSATRKNTARFNDTFYLWVSSLSEAIDAFIFDFENGYIPYLRAKESGASHKELERMIDKFLYSINIRTKKVKEGPTNEEKKKSKKGE